MNPAAVSQEPEVRPPSKYEARRAVYDALTSDLGRDRRDPQDPSFAILDFDGLLHVRHVDRFIDALLVWKESVRSDAPEGRMRSYVAKSIREGK